MTAHPLFKFGAIVSSLAIAGGVIWFNTSQINRGQAATPVPPVPATTPATSPATFPASSAESPVTEVIPLTVIDRALLQRLLQEATNEHASERPTMMSSSKSIVLTDTDAKVRRLAEIIRRLETQPAPAPATTPPAEQQMLMAGSKSRSVLPPIATKPVTTKPASNPATLPATNPNQKVQSKGN